MPRFNGRLLSFVPALLAAGACSVPPTEDPSAIDSVTTIGVALSADSFCTSGDFSVILQPRNSAGQVVISDQLQVACHGARVGQDTIACTIQDVTCTEGSDGTGQRTVALVILDDSGSMASSDPEKQRRDACADFVASLGPEDVVAIGDYGPSASTGSVDKGTAKLRVLQDFTGDKALAMAACQLTKNSGGTPLYEAVQEGVDQMLVEAKKTYGDSQYSMLLLSDGKPSSDTHRQDALDAAQRESVPIYTVGLGPASEGAMSETFQACETDAACGSEGACLPSASGSDKSCFLPDFDPEAVKVLQELANETSAAYAAASNPSALEHLFKNVSSAVREGKCTARARLELKEALGIGNIVRGTLTVGGAGAEAKYEFSVPLPDDSATYCE